MTHFARTKRHQSTVIPSSGLSDSEAPRSIAKPSMLVQFPVAVLQIVTVAGTLTIRQYPALAQESGYPSAGPFVSSVMRDTGPTVTQTVTNFTAFKGMETQVSPGAFNEACVAIPDFARDLPHHHRLIETRTSSCSHGLRPEIALANGGTRACFRNRMTLCTPRHTCPRGVRA